MNGFPDIGEHFGRYHLESELGRGGMGVVYGARDTTLQRPVALKILHPMLAADDEYRERFAREAATLARMDSPMIVQIFDYGERDGSLFLVTQLVSEGDLHRWLRQHGPMDVDSALAVTHDLCEALADAHEAGVVHRDVKPSNVFLRSRGGRLSGLLGDFGIATSDDAHLTKTGTVVGSTAYMAPERHRGARADERADIYSVGCVLWMVLSGKAPYSGTDVQIALAHMSQPVPQFDDGRPHQDELNELLAKSLAKKPGDRYPSVADMATAIKQLRERLGGQGGAPAQEPPRRREPTFVRTDAPAESPYPSPPAQPSSAPAPRAQPSPRPAAEPPSRQGPAPSPYPPPPQTGASPPIDTGSGWRPQASGAFPARDQGSGWRPEASGPFPAHDQGSGAFPAPDQGSGSNPTAGQRGWGTPESRGPAWPPPGEASAAHRSGPPAGDPQPPAAARQPAAPASSTPSADRPIAVVIVSGVVLVVVVIAAIILLAKVAGG